MNKIYDVYEYVNEDMLNEETKTWYEYNGAIKKSLISLKLALRDSHSDLTNAQMDALLEEEDFLTENGIQEVLVNRCAAPYDKYWVTTTGIVYNRTLKLSIGTVEGRGGGMFVRINDAAKSRTYRYIAQLMVEAFMEEDYKFAGAVHADKNYGNLQISNIQPKTRVGAAEDNIEDKNAEAVLTDEEVMGQIKASDLLFR